MRKVVANTTPLIAFAQRGRLDVPQSIYGELIIPEAVFSEIKSEPARSRIRSADWVRVVPIEDQTGGRQFSARLHAGEVEVMLLALEQGADLVVMDDNAAKKTAKYLGLSITGTFGVLLRAKHEGVIAEVKRLMDAMIADGLYVSEAVRGYVLEEAGEI